jgi:hypothetical protein
MPEAHDIIGVLEAAEILGESRWTVMRRIARGELARLEKLPGKTGVVLLERTEVERCKAELDAAKEAC